MTVSDEGCYTVIDADADADTNADAVGDAAGMPSCWI
jgi:hypothetical protein